MAKILKWFSARNHSAQSITQKTGEKQNHAPRPWRTAAKSQGPRSQAPQPGEKSRVWEGRGGGPLPRMHAGVRGRKGSSSPAGIRAARPATPSARRRPGPPPHLPHVLQALEHRQVVAPGVLGAHTGHVLPAGLFLRQLPAAAGPTRPRSAPPGRGPTRRERRLRRLRLLLLLLRLLLLLL